MCTDNVLICLLPIGIVGLFFLAYILCDGVFSSRGRLRNEIRRRACTRPINSYNLGDYPFSPADVVDYDEERYKYIMSHPDFLPEDYIDVFDLI